jgi:hypothetical protein
MSRDWVTVDGVWIGNRIYWTPTSRNYYAVTVLQDKLRGLSPQAKYTDRATAAVGEVVLTFTVLHTTQITINPIGRPSLLQFSLAVAW